MKTHQKDINQRLETQQIQGFAKSIRQAPCKHQKSTVLSGLVPYYLLPFTYYLLPITVNTKKMVRGREEENKKQITERSTHNG